MEGLENRVFLRDCMAACSLLKLSVRYCFSASVSQLTWSGRSLTQKKKNTAKARAGIASRMKSSCQPCMPKKELSSSTPASGAPMMFESSSDVSMRLVARARSPAVNQRGKSTE